MTGQITGIEVDGVLYDVALTRRDAPPPPPPPEPAPDPAVTAKAVRIGTSVFPVAAVNPVRGSGRDYPGGRGTNELVLYRTPVVQTETNTYGAEVCVIDGRISGTPMTNRAIVPTAPGCVLSGHGTARAWLVANAKPGAVVELLAEVPAPVPVPVPVPVPTPTPVPAGGRQLSVYLKMWPSKLPGLAAAAKPGVTEVRMAFMQGSPPSLVGWGSQTQAQVAVDAAALRARGVAVTASVGGSGGRVDTKSRDAFVRGVAALHATIGLDRIDWDVESSALVAADVIAISRTLYGQYGIMSTMAPNGSNIDQYLPVAVELYRAGVLAAYGQQFYDAPVSLAAAKGRIAEAIGAGLPPSVIQVGMMTGSDSRHWTLDVCAANAAAIRAQWDIGGAYLWSETHAEVADWAARMVAVLA